MQSGTTPPVRAEPPRRYPPESPRPPNKDRARVQGLLQGERAAGEPTPAGELQAAARSLARSVGADVAQARAIALSAAELARELGPRAAARSLVEVGPWARREARSDPAALAVRAVQARARNARGPRATQRSLFD